MGLAEIRFGSLRAPILPVLWEILNFLFCDVSLTGRFVQIKYQMIPQINYHMIQVLKPFQVWLRIQDVHHTG